MGGSVNSLPPGAILDQPAGLPPGAQHPADPWAGVAAPAPQINFTPDAQKAIDPAPIQKTAAPPAPSTPASHEENSNAPWQNDPVVSAPKTIDPAPPVGFVADPVAPAPSVWRVAIRLAIIVGALAVIGGVAVILLRTLQWISRRLRATATWIWQQPQKNPIKLFSNSRWGEYCKKELGRTRLISWLALALAFISVILAAYMFRYEPMRIEDGSFLYDRWTQKFCRYHYGENCE